MSPDEKIAALQEQVDNLQSQLDRLSPQLTQLTQRRLLQMDFTPGCVKQQALGEGNRFIRSGTAANLPKVGESVKANSSTIYYETDTFKIKVYDLASKSWKAITLS